MTRIRNDNSRKPVVVLTGRQRPFELCVLITCMLVGAGGLLFDSTTPTLSAVRALIPNYYWVWDLGLFLGPGIALIGAFVRPVVDALLIERIGLMMLGTLLLAFTSGSLLLNGFTNLGVLIFLGYSVGAFARTIQITKDIQYIRESFIPPVTPIISDDPLTSAHDSEDDE